MKIAIFAPNWIGDVVLATPAMRAVRRDFPNSEIVTVLRPYVADVLTGLDLCDRLMFHQPDGSLPEASGWRFISRLRKERFDIALLLPNSLRSAWLAWLSGAKRRIGFDRDTRGWLLTDRVPPRPRDVAYPVLDEYLRLTEQLGCGPIARETELAVSEEDNWLLEGVFGNVLPGFPTSGYIALNPGGAFGAAKHWPSASFGQLARRLAAERGEHVLVVCGPAERRMAREIVEVASHPHVKSLADVPPSLGLTKAAIDRARLLVSTDSGPRHFAAALQVPTVALFGPTHIAWSENYHPAEKQLQLKLDCGPCQKRVCPLGHHQCMRDLTVEQVFAAVCELDEATAPARRKAS